MEKRFLTYVIFIGLLVFCSAPASAADKSKPEQEGINQEEVPDWITRPVFQYSEKGRPDPFTSFLIARAARKDKVKKLSKNLSPLERVEVTQLRLIGIVWNEETPDQAVAMVELPDGKGFALKKGQRVGFNSGKVVSIKQDQVRVLEETEDIFGDIGTRAVVLKLHSSQGEGNE
ncbi:MAG: pilus assembly protein PilP [Desulfovibrionales bacterium]